MGGCGLSFTENEPNNDTGPPWTNVDDFGIVLVPDCSTTIAGMTDIGGKSDVFMFDTGSASFVTFIATWNSGDDELSFQLYNGSGDRIAGSDSSEPDLESLIWAVDAAGETRYFEIKVEGVGGVSYTLIISAN